jgi:hypothetical protein
MGGGAGSMGRGGTAPLCYGNRLRRVGPCRAPAGTRIILLPEGKEVRMFHEVGRPIRQLAIDPNRDYQPQE